MNDIESGSPQTATRYAADASKSCADGQTWCDVSADEALAAARVTRDAVLEATDTPWAPWWIAHTDDKERGRLNIICHLLSQVPYTPLEPREVKLPRRKPGAKYVSPDLPLKDIPTPF